MSYTLVIMLAFGYDFNRSPPAISIQSVQGFTTEQACINAAKKIEQTAVTGWDLTNRKLSLTCVVNTI